MSGITNTQKGTSDLTNFTGLSRISGASFMNDNFIFSVKTDNTGTSNNDQFTLPLVSDGTYDFNIDWGDNTSDHITAYNQAEVTHTYAGGAGTYTVKVYGTLKGWRFNNGADKLKLTNISQFGILKLGNSNGYFKGCANLTITATDPLDTSGTTEFLEAFYDCSSLTTVPSMGAWDMRLVTTTQSMFTNATNFNEPSIVNWDMSSVTTLPFMFSGASSFNQPIGVWNLSSVGSTSMAGIFLNATSFDQDLSNWGQHINQTSSLTQFLQGVTLSTANYNSMLITWAEDTWTTSLSPNFGSATYSGADAAEARFNFVNTDSWTIADGDSILGFTFNVKTDNAGTSSSTSFTYPSTSNGSYDAFYEWTATAGDRVIAYDDTALTHDFGSTGSYEVTVHGEATGFRFNNGGDEAKMLDISQWGTFNFGNNNSVFFGCTNLTISASDALDMSGAKAANTWFRFFRNCEALTTVPNMTTIFNGVAGVSNTVEMFYRCSNYNQDNNGFDMSSVTSSLAMYLSTTAYDQNFAGWDITSMTNLNIFMNNTSISTANYDATLVAWEAQSVLDNVSPNFGSSTYTSAGAGGTAHAALIADHSWTFADGGGV